MKKRISLVICAILVMALAIVPMIALVASADDTVTITFDNTSKRTEYSTSIQVWEENGIKVTNNKGGSTNNVGNYSNPARFYKSSSVTVEYKGMTSITFVGGGESKYKTPIEASLKTAGVGTVTVSGNNYTVTFDAPVDSFTFSTTAQIRVASISIAYSNASAGDETCAHENVHVNVVDPTCGSEGYSENECQDCSYVSEKYDKVPATGAHADANNDFQCDVCSVAMLPDADTELTIPQAIALSKVAGTSYTTGKYYVTGIISNIANTTYGNLTIEDEDGNSLYIYGTYSADGADRYDAMDVKPVAGDTIKVYTILGMYGSTVQGKNAWIVEHKTAECDHVDANGDYLCDNDCGVVVEPDANEALSFDDATKLGLVFPSQGYSTNKYYITGIVTEVVNATFGNVWIKDADGNTFYVYGLYNYDGSVRYDALEYAPQVNDEITVWGIIGNYNGDVQMKNGWLDEVVAHEHDYDADVTAPTCTADGYTTYTCACGHSYTEAGEAAKGHRYSNLQVFTFCEEEGHIVIGCGDCGGSWNSKTDKEAQDYLVEYPFFNLAPQGHNYENGVCTKCQATIGAINEAQVNLGADLGVKWYVVLPEGADVADYVFTVEFLGESFVLEAVEADGRYMYFFANIAPQNMGDAMKATLALGENTVVVDNYSVKKNLLNIAAADATLETLVADLLNYGAAAQVYMDYNADNLVNADVAFAGSADEIVNPGYTLEGNAKENSAYFKSANVLFASTNRVIVKVVVNTNATLVVGEKTYNLTAGEYEIYSRDIAAYKLFDNVTFTLTGEDGNVTTLNYSVAAYAATKAGNETAMGKLATALYYYAKSVKDIVG